MAYLNTTYIDGDLFVKNALNVKEIKIDSGSFVPKIEGGDADYDGLLDNFDKKLVVFNGDEGAITKSSISIGDGNVYKSDNTLVTGDSSDENAKVLYNMNLHNYDVNTMGLPLGLLLNNISSENLLINSTPIYLHEDKNPTWNHIFKGSVQDIIYKQPDHYDLTCLVKSAKNNTTLGVAFELLHSNINEEYSVNPTIKNGYSLVSWGSTNSNSLEPTENISSVTLVVAGVPDEKDSITINDSKLTISTPVVKEIPYIMYCTVTPIEQTISVVYRDKEETLITETLITDVESKVIFGEKSISGNNGSINFEKAVKEYKVYSSDNDGDLIATYAPGADWVLSFEAKRIVVKFD